MTLAIVWRRNPALLLAIVIALFLAVAVVGSAYGNGQLPLIGHNAPLAVRLVAESRQLNTEGRSRLQYERPALV